MFSGIVSFIMGIWNLLMIIPIVISIASLIISLTPTPKDDKVWAKVYKYLEVLAQVKHQCHLLQKVNQHQLLIKMVMV